LLLAATAVAHADWRGDLSDPQPGAFPMLRPMQLDYLCGWAGLPAGRVEVRFFHPAPDTCELDATAATIGFARALWRIDATHAARANVESLKPIDVHQREMYPSRTIQTDLDFDDAGVDRLRQSTNDKNPARHKRFDFQNLYDLQTALLYLRSQPLENGRVYHLVVYPANAPYLATVTVLGREQIKVKAGTYPAIKIDLRLEKVTNNMTLAPHGKFKHGTGWLSDDADRLPLRLNAQIFVGTVWLELQKVE
jgi:hypothetical protein